MDRVCKKISYLLITVLSISLAGCGGTVRRYKIHYTLLEHTRPVPHKVLVLPADISVYHISTGGVTEEIKKWSDLANRNARAAIESYAKQSKKFQLVPMPKLTRHEKRIMNEHIALYNIVGRMGLSYFSGPWQHKRSKFDYSIGPGLKFLADKTGADTAMLTVGIDYVSSGGRKAAAVGLLLAGIFIGHGARVPLGYSSLVVGLIDLRTGNLLWIKREHDSVRTLRNAQHVNELFSRLMADYPGIENYRKALGKK